MSLRFVAVFALALFVYVPRAYRTLSLLGDSAELVTAAAIWGVPHAPGYPFYVLVSHALSRLPLLDVAFRVHLGSAFFHAATVAIVARIIEAMTGRFSAALIGAIALGAGRVFFTGSLYAEVFPLNDLLFALLLWLALRAKEAATSSASRAWGALACVVGLGMSHHPMIVLAFPAAAILVAPSAARALGSPRRVLSFVFIAAAVPIAAYGSLVIAAARDPFLSWGDVHDAASLFRLVTRQDYGGLFHASRGAASGQLLERLDAFAISTAQSFGPVALALLLLGLIDTRAGLVRERMALSVAAVLAGPVFAALNAVDLHSEYRLAFFERFATMSHVALSILVGIGAARALELASRRAARAPGVVFSALLLILTVGPLLYRVRGLDFSSDRRGIAYAHDLVASAPDGALVLLKGDMATQAALYVCGVERRCGERIVFAPFQLSMPWRLEQVKRRYPALGLENVSIASLVERELARRPVLVHAEILDDALGREESAVPWRLLFRIFPDERALRDALPAYRELLSGVAFGAACEGCAPAQPPPFPAADAQRRAAYVSALQSHVRAARELGLSEEADALAKLANRL
jgi:hypothetical protein